MDETAIEFPTDRVTVGVPVTRIGDRHYRLEGVPPLMESPGYRDVIEAEPIGNGKLRFVRVLEKSAWTTLDFVVSHGWCDGEEGRAKLAEIESRGGYWEMQFGGLLFVCVPPGGNPDHFTIR